MAVTSGDTLPLVTVAISCYNHAAYVQKSILSVLQQNYPAIELLVFDDGSQDDSAEIIRKLADEYSFYFRAQKNQGLSATLNQALAQAKGEYFIPFGSDDIMMLDRVSRQIAYMQRHPDFGACGGNVLNIDPAGKVLARQRINGEAVQEFKHVLLDIGPGIAAPTMFFRTVILREIGGFADDIPLEDVYIKLQLTWCGYKIGVMNDVLAYYRLHDDNTYKRLEYMLNNVLASYDRFQESEHYQQARYQYLNSMLLKASKKDVALARKIFKMIPWSKLDRKAFRSVPRLLIKR